MSKELTQQFRATLIKYLKKPDNLKNQKALIAASYVIYQDAIEKYGLEPDKYLAHMEKIIKPAVDGIKIHPHLGETLGSFKRELTWSDEPKENQAFHALNMALEMYLRNNFINPAKVARDKLAEMGVIIQQLKAAVNNPYAEELESAHVKLKILVDQHFTLPPKGQNKESANFERKIALVCSEHKEAIESDAKIKSTFYSFLAIISNVLVVIGVTLADSFQRKSNFFQDASQAATNTLTQSGFNAPAIEVQDPADDEQNPGPT